MMYQKRRSGCWHGNDVLRAASELIIKGEAIKAHMRNIHMLPHDWPSMNRKGQVGLLQANWDLCEQFGVPDMEWDKDK